MLLLVLVVPNQPTPKTKWIIVNQLLLLLSYHLLLLQIQIWTKMIKAETSNQQMKETTVPICPLDLLIDSSTLTRIMIKKLQWFIEINKLFGNLYRYTQCMSNNTKIDTNSSNYLLLIHHLFIFHTNNTMIWYLFNFHLKLTYTYMGETKCLRTRINQHNIGQGSLSTRVAGCDIMRYFTTYFIID